MVISMKTYKYITWECKSEFHGHIISDILNLPGWIPKWHIEKAIEETVHFAKIWLENGNINREMIREIQHYFD